MLIRPEKCSDYQKIRRRYRTIRESRKIRWHDYWSENLYTHKILTTARRKRLWLSRLLEYHTAYRKSFLEKQSAAKELNLNEPKDYKTNSSGENPCKRSGIRRKYDDLDELTNDKNKRHKSDEIFPKLIHVSGPNETVRQGKRKRSTELFTPRKKISNRESLDDSVNAIIYSKNFPATEMESADIKCQKPHSKTSNVFDKNEGDTVKDTATAVSDDNELYDIHNDDQLSNENKLERNTINKNDSENEFWDEFLQAEFLVLDSVSSEQTCKEPNASNLNSPEKENVDIITLFDDEVSDNDRSVINEFPYLAMVAQDDCSDLAASAMDKDTKTDSATDISSCVHIDKSTSIATTTTISTATTASSITSATVNSIPISPSPQSPPEIDFKYIIENIRTDIEQEAIRKNQFPDVLEATNSFVFVELDKDRVISALKRASQHISELASQLEHLIEMIESGSEIKFSFYPQYRYILEAARDKMVIFGRQYSSDEIPSFSEAGNVIGQFIMEINYPHLVEPATMDVHNISTFKPTLDVSEQATIDVNQLAASTFELSAADVWKSVEAALDVAAVTSLLDPSKGDYAALFLKVSSLHAMRSLL